MISVIHVISDTRIGGAGRWLLNLLKHIDRSEFGIKVVLPEGSMLAGEIEALGFETIQIAGIADKSFDAGTIRKMSELFRREKPQIVHTHAALSARIAARLAGVKAIVHTKHCLDAPGTGVKKAMGACANRLLSDRVIAVSEAVRKNVTASGIPENKVETIYGGVEALKELDRDERNRLRSSLGIGKEALVVGIFARLVELKGHRYFIEAAGQVAQKHENARFLVVGAGPEEKGLRALTEKLGLEEKVVFTGFRSDVDNMMNIVDINVLCSVTEALSLSLIEGMSLGKPCVGTDTGGIPEVVREGENGLLVPVRDPKALAAAINRLVEDDSLREDMGRKGRQLMKSEFAADIMADKIEELYKKCLEGRR